jgi:predicted nucleotide-binding protein (sugar kinase/HSP70/actin superfamily)
MVRRPRNIRQSEGRDLVALRQEMMFKTFAPPQPIEPRGRIGLPLALTTYELYPLYARFLTELGYEVVLSQPGLGHRRTGAPMCYPSELMHAAVDNLLDQGVNFIFLPYMREFPAPAGHLHGYLCPVTQDIPGVIKAFFENSAARILTPEMGLAANLAAVTEQEAIRLAATLEISAKRACECWATAMAHQANFKQAYRTAIQEALIGLNEPAVILVGRPYVAFAPEVNLSVPRKIATRGFTVIPGDALSAVPPPNEHDVWHFTQDVLAAVDYARSHEDLYVCDISCFSCGPDAILHHRLRSQLEGQPFCFIEIDSHTAHAGIETRIGAFLDIIEARRRKAIALSSAGRRATPARLLQQNGSTSILTGGGRRLALDAVEVVHVSLCDGDPFISDMMAGFYGSKGWHTVRTLNTSAEILRCARKVCSGRECLPFLSMMGKVVQYLETRAAGEVTIFHLLEQGGPCQIGAWYDAAPLLFERLGEENALVAWPTARNNYLGQGDRFGAAKVAAFVLSDILAEIRSTLGCLAKKRATALALLDDLKSELVTASRSGLLATEYALRAGVRQLAQVALREPVEETPRILLFGGINRFFVDGPIRDFFEARGILTKTTEWSEFLCFTEGEDIVRLGFSQGHLAPAAQCSMPVLLQGLFQADDKKAAARAMRARIHIGYIEMVDRRWRGIAAESSLLFNPFVSFSEVQGEGHQRISLNGFTEAPLTVGRYAALLRSEAFDGYVNIGAFNCAPANSASAVIHSLSLRSETPYAIIEADGNCVTTSQLGQLETIAAQSRRRRSTILSGPAQN